MNFRKLFFSFLFLISSIFLIDNVKAFEYDNNYIHVNTNVNFATNVFGSYYVYLNDDDNSLDFYAKNKVYFSLNLDDNKYVWLTDNGSESSNYHLLICDDEILFDSSNPNFSSCKWYEVVARKCTTNSNSKYVCMNDYVKEHDISADYNNAKLTFSASHFGTFFWGTFDVITPEGKVLAERTYNPKPKTPYIDSSIEDINSVTIDDIKYVQKKKLKLKFNNYNLFKYKIFIAHDVPKGFYEITPNIVTNTYSINFEKDSILYLKILDRETDEVIYTQTFDISNISYPIPSLKLTLTDTEYLGDNQTIAPLHYTYLAEFNYFNTEKYTYKYYYPDYDSIINMLENNKYINVGVNGNMIFYVYDNDTGELVYTHTLDITGLYGSYFPQISMKLYETEYLNCGDEKRVYSVAIDVFFSILDKNKYIYEYSFDGINFDKYNITSDGHYFRHTIYSNSILYVRIKDINNDDVIVSQTFDISNITYDKDDITCILGNNFNSNIEALQKYLVELKETSEIFNQIFNSFYKSLPTVISQGLAYVYIIVLIIVALKIGGWK